MRKMRVSGFTLVRRPAGDAPFALTDVGLATAHLHSVVAKGGDEERIVRH